MKFRRILFYCLIVLMALILFIFFFRLISARQLDDVTPGIPCSNELLDKADVFYIVPNFENQSIAENKEWCKQILDMNKKLELHGVLHTYKEFSLDRSQEYLQEGIFIFEQCFNQTPERFKAPQLSISKNNREIVKNNNLKLDNYLNLIFHKVYHCNDSDRYLKNKYIDIF